VASKGPEVFYRGEIADAIVRCCERNGGLITKADLEGFRTQWLDPISTTYRGHEIFCPPPPCEGIQYLETLNILEGHDLAALGHNSAEALHLFIEAGKLAQVDRAEYSAIPDPPTKALLSKRYAAERRRLIGDRAMVTGGERYTPLSKKLPGEVLPGDVAALLKECTTHFDAVDAEGNAVAVTQSLGGGFGSGVVVDGTGIALNNFINWFDREPESPNAIGPSRKIEMCLSPAQVWKDGKLFCVIGTPGSYGIMFTTPQMMMNLIDHGMNVQAAIEAPRVKATSPGRLVDIEARIPQDVRQALQARGHELHVIPDWSALVGGGQGIMVDQATGALGGGADPRRDGYAMGW
jgi:gamma-glutamyltranspeptidase/glutathione hydrolase